MVVIVGILGADVMLAVLPAVIAEVAELAELVDLIAVAAGVTNVLLKLRAVRAELMLAVVVLLTVLTQEAVLTLHVIRALAAAIAEMIIILCRLDAIVVGAVFIRSVVRAAAQAQPAVFAEFFAVCLDAFSALFTEPAVFSATGHAVLAAGFTPHHALSLIAHVAFRAVGLSDRVLLTEMTVVANALVTLAHAAFPAMPKLSGNGQIVQTFITESAVFAPFLTQLIRHDIAAAADADSIATVRTAFNIIDTILAKDVQIRQGNRVT